MKDETSTARLFAYYGRVEDSLRGLLDALMMSGAEDITPALEEATQRAFDALKSWEGE